MKNIDFLLNKLRYVTDTKTDKELCKTLNISYSTMDTWKNNDKIPEKRLLEFSQKLNIPFEDLNYKGINENQSQQIKEICNTSEIIETDEATFSLYKEAYLKAKESDDIKGFRIYLMEYK